MSDTEISVVTNAIGYILDGGDPSDPNGVVPVAGADLAKWRTAAERAISHLDSHRAEQEAKRRRALDAFAEVLDRY